MFPIGAIPVNDLDPEIFVRGSICVSLASFMARKQVPDLVSEDRPKLIFGQPRERGPCETNGVWIMIGVRVLAKRFFVIPIADSTVLNFYRHPGMITEIQRRK